MSNYGHLITASSEITIYIYLNSTNDTQKTKKQKQKNPSKTTQLNTNIMQNCYKACHYVLLSCKIVICVILKLSCSK